MISKPKFLIFINKHEVLHIIVALASVCGAHFHFISLDILIQTTLFRNFFDKEFRI